MLVRRSLQLKNTRRRERRLRGKLEDLMARLKQERLLSTQAEELLSAYKGEQPYVISDCLEVDS